MIPDWSAQAEPVPYAKLTDPHSLNLYMYGGDNPVFNRDPDGHFSDTVTADGFVAPDPGFTPTRRRHSFRVMSLVSPLTSQQTLMGQ